MFTGIIERVGVVRSVRGSAGGKIVSVELGELLEGAKIGDSIAINGVCLTVTGFSGGVGDFDVSGETLAKSTMGDVRVGLGVNLERAMAADGRFGGHIVQGHVDGSARVKSVERVGEFANVRFSVEKGLASEMIAKGSVAIDGISLTIAELGDGEFLVAVIPATWEATNLRSLKVGDVVNIETDIITKTVKRQLENMLGKNKGGGLSAERLKELGF
jgi:riboflavin synthase